MTPDRRRPPATDRPALRRFLAAAAAAVLAAPAAALELSWSGFGTVGWAQSDRPWTYERSVDDHGSAARDSVLGLQADARWSPQWSATVQLKLAQALDRDDAWAARSSWAFVGWRPDDDWLLRAGRLRVPLYLYSEQLDVGVTHSMARLPAEMYAIAPSTEYDGLAATRTWGVGGGELSLDAYAGRAGSTARLWSRDGVPGTVAPGARFADIDIRLLGASLAWRQPDATWRASLHRASTRRGDGTRFPVVPVEVRWPDGSRFYRVSGPGVETVDAVSNLIVTLGVEQRLARDWRVVGEFARNVQHDTDIGSDTVGGYVALFRDIGAVTPYVSVGRLRSTRGALRWYRRLTGEPLAGDPAGLPPGSAQAIDAAQRLAAESAYAADQRTLALGASWTVATGRKLKLEWARTRIGETSRLVDTPPGAGAITGTQVDVWSANVSFAF